MLLSTRVWLVVGVLSFGALPAQAQSAAPGASVPVAIPATAPAVVPTAALAPPPEAKLLPPTLVPGNYKTYLKQRYANDKEGQAVIHLYARKSTGGLFWLLGGGAFVGFIASQTGTTVSSSGTRTTEVTPLGYAIAGGVPAIIAIVRLGRYGNESLYKALAEYDGTHRLPDKVAAKIKNSDYK